MDKVQEKKVDRSRLCTWEEARELIRFRGPRDVLARVWEVFGVGIRDVEREVCEKWLRDH